MKITGIIVLTMAALLNMLPFAALSPSAVSMNPSSVLQCHCEAMKKMEKKVANFSPEQKKSYLISCSSSDKQTQQSQNHVRAIIVSQHYIPNLMAISYAYPVVAYAAVGIAPLTDTPPPKPLS